MTQSAMNVFGSFQTVRLVVAISLAAFGLLGAGGCTRRGYNQASELQTLTAPGKERLAFAYVGFGWCYYVEDKSYTPTIIKTGLEDAVVDVNLDSGVERKDKYEVVFSRRKFLRAHEWPLEFEVVGHWFRKQPLGEPIGPSQYDIFEKLSAEMSGMRSAINMRKFEKDMCDAVNRGEGQKLRRIPSLEEKKRITEYALRCDKETGEIIRRTDYEQLELAQYQNLRKTLGELTTHPDWKKYQRVGTPCREDILQFEVSRGKYLGAETRKLW